MTCLPVPAKRPDPALTAETPAPTGLITVLVVDDDPRVRAAIRETIALETDLLLAGEAADAVTALAVASAVEPRVALVDVLLPDVESGLELVQRLSAQPWCSVIAMSVRSATRHVALAAGAIAFVEKSDDIEALLSAVRTAARPAAGTDK
jgi:DNA-binding NarL/FixJ family response regulator